MDVDEVAALMWGDEPWRGRCWNAETGEYVHLVGPATLKRWKAGEIRGAFCIECHRWVPSPATGRSTPVRVPPEDPATEELLSALHEIAGGEEE